MLMGSIHVSGSLSQGLLLMWGYLKVMLIHCCFLQLCLVAAEDSKTVLQEGSSNTLRAAAEKRFN